MNKASEYTQLQSQAATLADDIALARAFKSQEAAQWAKVPRRAIQELLAGLVLWSKADASHNAAVPVPRFLSLKVYCYFGQEAHLLDLLRWALTGAFTEEELKALGSG